MTAVADGSRGATLTDLLHRQAVTSPEAPFLQVGDEIIGYADFEARTLRAAAGLAAAGLGARDRLAFMAPTSSTYVVMMFAAARLGVICVPLSIYLKGESLMHQLADSGARAVFCDEAGAHLLAGLDSLPDALETVIHEREVVETPGARVTSTAADVLAGEPLRADWPLSRAADTFAIVYTSGTTGLPKGCVMSLGYAVSLAEALQEFADLRDDDVVFTAAPTYHIGSMTPIFGALRRGLKVVLEPSFSASGYLGRARDTGATLAVGVGFIAQALLAQPEGPADRDHGLRAMSTVQLSTEEQRRFRERFGMLALSQQYGQTECWPVSHVPFELNDIDVSCGIPFSGLTVEVHDDDGLAVPDGESGEIVVRPLRPHVMFDGYWGRDSATLEAFRGLWYHTGDRGYFDQGRLVFVDRKKDTIRRRGENISAFELERAGLRHRKIDEIAVFGTQPAGETEQSVQVTIVGDPSLTPDEVFAHFTREVPYYAVPRFVDFVSSLPRNASGRVLKDELRAAPGEATRIDLSEMGLTVAKEDRRRTAAGTA